MSLTGLRSAPFLGIRWVHESIAVEGRFPRRTGHGVRRTELIAALVERARELGAELRYGQAVDSWRATDTDVEVTVGKNRFLAGFMVGADGLHSSVRRKLHLERPGNDPRRFGIRRHYSVPPWSPFLEVHLGNHVEIAITPVGNDEVDVAIIGPGDGRSFEELLAQFPIVEARLQDVGATSEAGGGGPFRRRVKRRYSGRVALVGDAAGYVDPITAEGLSLGFASAFALAQTIAEQQPLAEYERAYRRLSRGYDQVTQLVLAVTARPWLRRRTMRMLANNPDALTGLLAVNDGSPWIRTFGARGLLRMLLGLIPPTSGRRYPGEEVPAVASAHDSFLGARQAPRQQPSDDVRYALDHGHR